MRKLLILVLALLLIPIIISAQLEVEYEFAVDKGEAIIAFYLADVKVTEWRFENGRVTSPALATSTALPLAEAKKGYDAIEVWTTFIELNMNLAGSPQASYEFRIIQNKAAQTVTFYAVIDGIILSNNSYYDASTGLVHVSTRPAVDLQWIDYMTYRACALYFFNACQKY